MSEVELMRQIQLKASELGHRLWRNNVGVGWVGPQVRVSHSQMIMMHPGDVLIRNAKPLHAGLAEGSSDLIGITKNGQFQAVEVKAPKGRLREGQESFLNMVKRLGGLGFEVRSLEDYNV